MGTVHGNIIASGRVEMRAGCQVQGDVRALRLAIEENAAYCGKVDLTQGASKQLDSPRTQPVGAVV
jgi:cytoskeletal protein CcmA (bactofilin family)